MRQPTRVVGWTSRYWTTRVFYFSGILCRIPISLRGACSFRQRFRNPVRTCDGVGDVLLRGNSPPGPARNSPPVSSDVKKMLKINGRGDRIFLRPECIGLVFLNRAPVGRKRAP